MHKEKTLHTFEVSYQDIKGDEIRVPVTAEDFRIRDNFIVFSRNEEDFCAFRNWNFVLRTSRERVQPPSEFTQSQLELVKKKKAPLF